MDADTTSRRETRLVVRMAPRGLGGTSSEDFPSHGREVTRVPLELF